MEFRKQTKHVHLLEELIRTAFSWERPWLKFLVLLNLIFIGFAEASLECYFTKCYILALYFVVTRGTCSRSRMDVADIRIARNYEDAACFRELILIIRRQPPAGN